MHDGLILALISIGVVFTALLILYLFYGLMGEIFMRSAARRSGEKLPEAPAAADDEEEKARIAAAIAVALELENSRTLTLRPGSSGWRDYTYGFRQSVDFEKSCRL